MAVGFSIVYSMSLLLHHMDLFLKPIKFTKSMVFSKLISSLNRYFQPDPFFTHEVFQRVKFSKMKIFSTRINVSKLSEVFQMAEFSS
jgi:hypothetical protein